MQWTTEQEKTIDTRNHNILVAAAAGSGKTAVLVERIKKMVTEENVPIDSMLIVTFTNAAAAEMKEKIRRALKEKVRTNPKLRPQLDRMQRAQISTFHSFALDVIHHFFYMTDVEPDFTICDDAQEILLREEALDEMLEAYYAAEDPGFYQLMDWYGSERENGQIKNVITGLYNRLMAMGDPFGFLEEKISEMEEGTFENSEGMAFYRKWLKKKLDTALSLDEEAVARLSDAGLERMVATLEPLLNIDAELANAAEEGRLEAAAEQLKSIPTFSLRAKKDEKDSYEEVKAEVKNFRERAKKIRDEVKAEFAQGSLSQQLELLEEVAPVARNLQRVLLDFDQRFREKKAEKKVITFNDIEHYCLEILQNSEAAAFYRNKFSYIFVDEYQDTSVLQETIIEMIAGDKNLFMVGDIKQSIYQFRLAEPEIFRRRYDEYGLEQKEDSIHIDLNMNFRSKGVILDWINQQFDDLMEGYDEAARLKPGIEDVPERYLFPPEIRLLDTQAKEEADAEIQKMKDTELEAHMICDIIEENVGKNFFDSKASPEPMARPMRYRDMAILSRSVSGSAQIFIEVMKQRGIPVFVDDNKGYFSTMEINVVMNLLSVLDNRYRDVPLLSVLRSEIFGFTTDQLAEVRLYAPEGSYAEAFLEVASGETKAPQDFVTRCHQVTEQLEAWRDLAATMPLSDFLWEVLQDTGYYLYMGAMPGGEQRQANLRALVDRTEAFQESGQSSLYGFIQYIENVKKKKVDVGQVSLLSEKDDVVRIMTIHKSKGLEFPLVIVAGMGKRLTYTTGGDMVLFHKDVGLGLCYMDPANKITAKTLPYRIILKKFREEEVAEQIRVLYVAMTRARDKLYLTGTVKNGEKFLSEKESGLTNDGTYIGMLQSLGEHFTLQKVTKMALGQTAVAQEAEEGKEESQEIRDMVEERLSYRYPYETAGTTRSKYSVSSLNAKAHEPVLSRQGEEMEEGPERAEEVESEPKGSTRTLPVPAFLQEEESLSAATRGTVYHNVMERLDFPKTLERGTEEVEDTLERLLSDGVLLSAECQAVRPKKIAAFFASELGKRCCEAAQRGQLFREQPFTLQMEQDGENIMVQGIIDGYFEEEDGLVLFDYKTNWIDWEKPREEEFARIGGLYQKQLELYARALTAATGKPVKEKWLYLFSADCPMKL